VVLMFSGSKASCTACGWLFPNGSMFESVSSFVGVGVSHFWECRCECGCECRCGRRRRCGGQYVGVGGRVLGEDGGGGVCGRVTSVGVSSCVWGGGIGKGVGEHQVLPHT
jgi:hypothetical protein